MEKFIKKQKTLLVIYRILYITFILMAISTLILSALDILKPNTDSFISGAYIGGATVLIVQAIQIKKALKDEDKMRKLYVAQTDERLLMINKSTSHLTINITIVLLLVTGSVFAYINEVIYYTLWSVMVAMIIIMGFCDLYFRKKF